MNHTALLTFILAASISVAHAAGIPEVEPNHPITAPQRLSATGDTARVDAYLGNAANDVDFFRIYAQSGDVLRIDIDGGIGGAKSTNLLMLILDQDLKVIRYSEDADSLDEGSISTKDPRIDDFVAPKTGFYYVGVTNWPRWIRSGGEVEMPALVLPGDYSLEVSGMSSPVRQVPIEVKPGNDDWAPINPKSRGKTPVALLSTVDFNAMLVDQSSLTFGATGTEDSLSHCNKQGRDVNADGRPDLVCHFNTEKMGFVRGDTEGKLRGRLMTTKGEIEGRGFLKVVPEKK